MCVCIYGRVRATTYQVSDDVLLLNVGNHSDTEVFGLFDVVDTDSILLCPLFVRTAEDVLQTLLDGAAHLAMWQVLRALHLLVRHGWYIASLLQLVQLAFGTRERPGGFTLPTVEQCTNLMHPRAAVVTLDPGLLGERIVLYLLQVGLADAATIVKHHALIVT